MQSQGVPMKSQLLTLVLSLCFFTPALAIPEKGHKIMVAAPSHRAIEVAQKVILRGGNVADVAVAVELTLAVTSPYYGSLGGGGFAMIKMGEQVEALDFREKAPTATGPSFYKDKEAKASINGPLAVGIPGIAAGLWALHKKYGKLSWRSLLKEPIKLAENGFRVSGDWVKLTKRTKPRFNESGIQSFFKKDQSSYKPGEVLKQPRLAKALRLLQKRGHKGFYQSSVSTDIVESMQKLGGVMTQKDFDDYSVRWLKPVTRDFLGHTVHMMPPPSSSGVVTSALIRLLEILEVPKKTPLSAEELHYLGESLKIAFRGRTELGDPDFHKNPIAYLTSDEYLKPLAKKVRKKRSLKLKPLSSKQIPKQSSETTNFTVMDKDGNTIVMTITLNGNYGSAMVSDRYRIALNNEMDDFTTRPGKPNMFGLVQGAGNYVQAGKRPLSSMSPTILTKNGKTVMGVGAAGGPRIITSVFQTWYRVISSGFDVDKALQSPRVHHQFLPNTLFYDEVYNSPDAVSLLKKKGHTMKASWMGKANAIVLNKEGLLEAAHDSRVEGSAGGI